MTENIVTENHSLDEVHIFKIRDMIGHDILYHCSSIIDLRYQLALSLETWAPCVLLLDKNGKVIMDDDLSSACIPTILFGINDTTLAQEMKEWNGKLWKRNIDKYLRSQYLCIIDALYHILQVDRAHSIVGELFAEYCGDDDSEMALYMLSYHITITEEYIGQALKNASWNGHLDLVNDLLHYNVYIKNDDCGEALVKAACNGYIDIVSLLLDKKNTEENKIDLEEYIGRALVYASLIRHHTIVTLLLTRGVDVNGKYSGRACMNASTKGHMQIISLLLDHGLDCNGEFAQRSLINASEFGHLNIILLFLGRGMKLSGYHIDQAYTVATRNNYHEIASILICNPTDDRSITCKD